MSPMSSDGRSPISVNILGCCMSRDVFNIKTDTEYSVKAFVQRQNPFLIFQHTNVNISPEEFEKYYLNMLETHPDCPLTNRMYHKFNRRSMRTLINGNACSRLLDNKGDWIVMDTHYAQSLDAWRLSDGRWFQASYSCYMDTVTELIPEYANMHIEKFYANINMDMLADSLSKFLKDNWNGKIILINSRPAEYRVYNGNTIPLKTDEYFKESSKHMCKIISDRIPVHLIELPEKLVSRDGNLVHYTNDTLAYIRSEIDSIIKQHYNPTYPYKE
mgnify:CR=1 FL=1